MSFKLLALIIFTVSLSAIAQLLLKLGVSQAKVQEAIGQGVGETITAFLWSGYIWSGVILYGFGMGLWLLVLSKVDLSLAYPFVGLSFILTMVFGIAFLSEHITISRLAGTLFIVAGCILVARSA